MTVFISYAEKITTLLPLIIAQPSLHAKWINTLSYLENCGARKIAACQHPIKVQEELLKHAAEEFRHAYYLKKQIARVTSQRLGQYQVTQLLGGVSSLQYLNRLDLQVSRYLSQKAKIPKSKVKEIAYLLVTYAIELRASELYPIYERLLRACDAKVTVKSILLEEQEHLREMEAEVNKLESGIMYSEIVCKMEADLCNKWLMTLENELVK